MKIWKERFPEAELHEFDAGHYLLEDKLDDITSVIDSFLEKH